MQPSERSPLEQLGHSNDNADRRSKCRIGIEASPIVWTIRCLCGAGGNDGLSNGLTML